MHKPNHAPSEQRIFPQLSADSQRLVAYAQAVVQAASRLEERSWEKQLDAQVQKLLKNGNQDAARNGGALTSCSSCRPALTMP